MRCPHCDSHNTKVSDSRNIEEETAIRRRRLCSACDYRFTTLERTILVVHKRNGEIEDFSRDKLIRGVSRACQGRNIDEAELKKLAQRVEHTVRSRGSEVRTQDIGRALLEPLRELDEVAYLRFASVYKTFTTAEDFEEEIAIMRTAKDKL